MKNGCTLPFIVTHSVNFPFERLRESQFPLPLFLQYEILINQFKTVHKESEALKNSGYSTGALRKDIEEMENEKEIVAKRIERMERKVGGFLKRNRTKNIKGIF